MICKFHKPTQNNLVWTQFTVTSTNAWRRSHEHDPKTFLSSLGQRKTVLWSDESKFDILFWKTWTPHPPNLREDPACYQRSVQKPPPLTVRGLISAYRTGSLHIWKSTECWKICVAFRATYFSVLPCLFQGRLCIFQKDEAKTHTACIKTVESGCLTGLPFMDGSEKKTVNMGLSQLLWDKLLPSNSKLPFFFLKSCIFTV